MMTGFRYNTYQEVDILYFNSQHMGSHLKILLLWVSHMKDILQQAFCWGLEIRRKQQQGILPSQRSQLARDCLV